jgi:sulfur carrier protein ThiS
MKLITVDDQSMRWYPGLTLAELVAALPDGYLYSVVRLNGRLVSRPDFVDTRVPDNAVVEPIPLIAGG